MTAVAVAMAAFANAVNAEAEETMAGLVAGKLVVGHVMPSLRPLGSVPHGCPCFCNTDKRAA